MAQKPRIREDEKDALRFTEMEIISYVIEKP